MLLDEARNWLEAGLEDGVECPCCGQLAKIYKRKLHGMMAFVLLLIYRHKGDEWIHVPSLINAKKKSPTVWAGNGGDWSKLLHWGLIEALVAERSDGSTRVGYYKITDKGRLFAQNKIRVPHCVWLYNGQRLDRKDTKTVSIVEALGDKFDYTELMGAR
jgi:hypothetical protein